MSIHNKHIGKSERHDDTAHADADAVVQYAKLLKTDEYGPWSADNDNSRYGSMTPDTVTASSSMTPAYPGLSSQDGWNSPGDMWNAATYNSYNSRSYPGSNTSNVSWTLATSSNNDNKPEINTPKSDLWNITGIDEEQPYILGNAFSHGYIHQVEKLFAETVLSTSRDIRTANRFVNNLYDLVFADMTLSLLDSIDPTAKSGGGLKGGHIDDVANGNLNAELAFQSTDTQHDFKPGRNKVYPRAMQGGAKNGIYSGGASIVNKSNGLLVYNKLNAVIGSVPTYGNDYIMSSPIAFEEDTKTDYLLGELAGGLEDMYYYWTCKDDIPSNWNKKRQAFFGLQGGDTVKVQSINTLVFDVKQRDYSGWVLDACVSGRVSSALGQRKKNLANIWDPVRGTFSANELVENIETTKLSRSPVSATETGTISSSYTIYNCIIQEAGDFAGKSLYDVVYDRLLNGISDNLNIKLRLAVNTQNICHVAIIITVNGTLRTFVINSGFSVEQLSRGLRYIDDICDGRSDTSNVDITLKSIIDFVYSTLTVSDDEKCRIIQTMLYRFKSSGDHGTSDMVKILNAIGLNYLFLSGDNLAYVYAMSSVGAVLNDVDKGLPTPTVATYYRSNAKTEDGDDEEEDDDVPVSNADQIDGNHFIVAYFPSGDDLPKKYIKLLENLNALYGLSISIGLAISEIDLSDPIVGVFPALIGDISEMNKTLYGEIVAGQSTVFDSDSVAIMFNGSVNRTLETITAKYPYLIPFGTLDTKDALYQRLPLELLEATALASALNELVNKLFFMHKYSDIVKLNMEMIEADRAAFSPIVSLVPEQSSGRSKRSITTRLTGAYTAVKKSLLSSIQQIRGKGTQSEQITKEKLQSTLSSTFSTDRKTEYDRVLAIKQTLSANSKSLFTRLSKKLGFSDSFVTVMKDSILRINNPLIQQLEADIRTNAGNDPFAESIIDLFKSELKSKIYSTSLIIESSAAASSSSSSIESIEDISMEPAESITTLDPIDANLNAIDTVLDREPSMRTLDDIPLENNNIILTIPVNKAKKSIISKITGKISSVGKKAAKTASSFASSVMGLNQPRTKGLLGGAKSIKHHNLKKPKRQTKKLPRVRKTRKNTKHPKYIKKNATRRRR